MSDDPTKNMLPGYWRGQWLLALMRLKTDEEIRAEIKEMLGQLFWEAADAQDDPLTQDVRRVLDAWDGKPTLAQGEHREKVEKDHAALTDAVEVFLRQPMNPHEGSRVFPISAVEALERALRGEP